MSSNRPVSIVASLSYSDSKALISTSSILLTPRIDLPRFKVDCGCGMDTKGERGKYKLQKCHCIDRSCTLREFEEV